MRLRGSAVLGVGGIAFLTGVGLIGAGADMNEADPQLPALQAKRAAVIATLTPDEQSFAEQYLTDGVSIDDQIEADEAGINVDKSMETAPRLQAINDAVEDAEPTPNLPRAIPIAALTMAGAALTCLGAVVVISDRTSAIHPPIRLDTPPVRQ